MVEWLIDWWVDKRSDIFVGLLLAVVVFLVEEARGYFSRKRVLKQQRKGFRQELKEMLLENTKNVFSWIQDQPIKQIDPELEVKFAGAAETTASAWFSGGGIPSNAFVISKEHKPGDFKPAPPGAIFAGDKEPGES